MRCCLDNVSNVVSLSMDNDVTNIAVVVLYMSSSVQWCHTGIYSDLCLVFVFCS